MNLKLKNKTIREAANTSILAAVTSILSSFDFANSFNSAAGVAFLPLTFLMVA